MQNSTTNLAIVTVSGPADEQYVRLNIEAIHKKNPQITLPIYVIDNGKSALIPDGIKSDLDAIILDGVPQQVGLPANYRGSYQHADALNVFFKTQKISKRYVLVIDPDFYVVRDGWIQEIISYMQQENLTFFGAPWHPRWYSKYRYFPCVHFMCIDTHKIDVSTLNFSPSLPLEKPFSEQKKTLIITIAKFIYFMTIQRKIIGKAKDTGYQIFERFYPLEKISLLQPVMGVKINFIQAKFLQFRLARTLESLIPDHLSYLPKENNYYTDKGFIKFGLANLSALGWEEFMWKDKPFAFHLRRFIKKDRDVDAEISQIQNMFFNKQSR